MPTAWFAEGVYADVKVAGLKPSVSVPSPEDAFAVQV